MIHQYWLFQRGYRRFTGVVHIMTIMNTTIITLIPHRPGTMMTIHRILFMVALDLKSPLKVITSLGGNDRWNRRCCCCQLLRHDNGFFYAAEEHVRRTVVKLVYPPLWNNLSSVLRTDRSTWTKLRRKRTTRNSVASVIVHSKVTPASSPIYFIDSPSLFIYPSPNRDITDENSLRYRNCSNYDRVVLE